MTLAHPWRLLVPVLSLLATLAVAEVALRLLEPRLPFSLVPTDYVNTVGIRNWPGHSGCYDKEGYSCYSINADGWRDVAHTRDKPPGTTRIAVVGDSFVEALQVEIGMTFWNRLETTLRREGRSVEVLAFGMSGFDPAQAYEALRHHVLAYAPDLVIFAFFPANDVRDSVGGRAEYPWKPVYTLDERDELRLDRGHVAYVEAQNRGLRYAYRRARNASRVLTVVDLGAKGLASAARRLAGRDDAAREARRRHGRRPELYREPPPGSDYDRGWRLTERLILAMRALAASRGADFVVLGVTNGDRVYDLEPSPDFDPLYPEKRFGAFAASHGLRYVPVAERLRQAHRRGVRLHGFHSTPESGHWNEAGHAEAAAALHDHLVSNRLVPPAR